MSRINWLVLTQHPWTHHPLFLFWGHPVGLTPILELRTHFYTPSAMGSLAREQEPSEKKCTVHAASIHGGADSRWLTNLHFIVQKYSKSSRLAILLYKEKILTKVKRCFMGNVKSQSPCVPKTGSEQGGSLLAFWEHPPLGAFTIVKIKRQKLTWAYTILDQKW